MIALPLLVGIVAGGLLAGGLLPAGRRAWHSRPSRSRARGDRGTSNGTARAGAGQQPSAEHDAMVRLVAEHATDMVSRMAADGRRIYISPACERVVGVPAEELLGTGLMNYIHPEDRPAMAALVRRMLGGEVEEDFLTYRVRNPQRGEVWIEGRSRLLRDPLTGAPDGYVAVSRDVTERRAAEILLRDSEARYRLLADHTSDAVTCLDLDLNRIYVSPAFQALFGREPATALGVTPASFIHPEDAAHVTARMHRLIAGQADTDRIVNRVRHQDGRWLWVDASLSLARDAAGRPAFIVCSLRDITAQKAAEIAMAEANNLLALSQQVANLGHWRYEPASGRRDWSAEIFRIYGLDPTGPVPAVAAAIAAYHPDDRATMARAFERVVTERTGYDLCLRLFRPDGEMRHVQTRSVVELGPDGTVTAVFGVFLDITDQVRAEAAMRKREERERQAIAAKNLELERLARHLARARDAAEIASRAKSQFLATVSHELRTPLNAILGSAQLLHMDGSLGTAQQARILALLDSGQSLLEMINRVLDLAEIEAGQVSLQVTDTDPCAVARACVDLLRPAAVAKALELAFEAAADMPRIATDPARLRQVLLNLLGNAVKFTRHGAVVLRIAPTDAGGARFEVADTGPGIPAAERHRLFQPFERLQADIAGAVEGAGMGLGIAARLTALLGGEIGHADNPGGGSIFWAKFPRAMASARTRLASATPPAAAMRLLVVDDMAMNRDIIGTFLRAAGHAVTYAGGGEEAVAAVARGDFDAILMDVRMPEVDGLEATRRIRALPGERAAVPVIAVTAQAFVEQVTECRRAGMDAHLAKPFTQAALLEVIGRVVEAARPAAAAASGGADDDRAPDPSAVRPVVDEAAFAHTATVLPASLLGSYLRTLAGRAEALLRMLHAAGDDPAACAAAAHSLAGSAGMFGFTRLGAAARGYERAVELGDAQAGAAAARLTETIEATLPEIARRVDSGSPEAAAVDAA